MPFRQESIHEKRFQKVFVYIEAHLDDPLDLETLAQVASISRFHFQRQFSARYGISISSCIRKMRLKRAAFELAYRAQRKVIDVALSNGYDSAEAFTRAFKNETGQSPVNFRRSPDWTCWQQNYQPVMLLRSAVMALSERPIVQIVDFPETSLAVLEHRGPPQGLGYSIARFIEWRRSLKLHPSRHRTFNLVYDDPDDVPSHAYRFDLGVELHQPMTLDSSQMVLKTIPAGRCAVVRHRGSDDTIGQIAKWLYVDWLDNNDEELRDFPLYFERISFFPDVSEQDMVTDIYLPLMPR